MQYRIGMPKYVGTARTQERKIKFNLKYCKRCKVYYDTDDERCLCCNIKLRINPRDKYIPVKTDEDTPVLKKEVDLVCEENGQTLNEHE